MNKRESSSKEENLIYIGKVVKVHGLKGEVEVGILTDRIDRYKESDKIYLLNGNRSKEVRVEGLREYKRGLLVKFEELNSREEAKEWVGSYVAIPPYDYVREEDEYKIYEIDGLEVIDDEGSRCGLVIEVKDYAGNILLVVDTGKKKILLPFVKEYCKIELDRRLIIVLKKIWEELNEI